MVTSVALAPRATGIRSSVRPALTVFVVSRLLLAGVAVISIGDARPASDGPPDLSATPATPGWHNAWNGTDRWDAGWYVRLAEDGFSSADERSAFFPAYPVVVGVASDLIGVEAVDVALVVSHVAFALALVILHALVRREDGETIASRTVVLVACFPTSFFFFAPYSEALFLAAVVLAFWWAGSDRWVLAGLASAFAGVTRAIGFVTVPSLAIDTAARRTQRPFHRAAVAGLLLAVAGPALYVASWWFAGDPFGPWTAQATWQRELAFPLETLGRATSLGVEGVFVAGGWYWTADLVVTGAALAALVLGWRVIRAPYRTYAVLSVLVPLCLPFPPRPLLSMPRFLATVFPLAWATAARLERRSWFVAVALSSAALWAVLAIAFMNWRPIF